MERIIIEDIFDVAEMMYEFAMDDGLHSTFVGNYEDVVLLVKELALFEETVFDRIDVEPVELQGYDREYYVDVDADMHVWVEKAYSYDHDIYMMNETEVLLVADNCNSKILERVDYDTAFEVGYEDEEPECNGDCENCHVGEPDRHEVITRVATDDNGKLRGFEKSWETKEDGMTYHSTYSFFSSDEKMLKDMLKNFNIEY